MTAPEIRFAGFEGEWEPGNLKDLGIIKGGGTPSTAVPEFWDGDIPWFSPSEISKSGSGIVSTSVRTITPEGVANSGANLLPTGTVLITSRASIGHVAVIGSAATTNQGFASLTPFTKESTWFIYNWVLANQSLLEQFASGSTFLEIRASTVGGMDLFTPSLPEQKRIGRLFHDLDKLVEATQAKIDTLRNLKQTMLVKLFPQPGNDHTNVPEIRFAGFEGEWELNKLSDHANFNKGTGYSKKDLQSSGSPIVLYGRLYTNFEAEIKNVDTFVTAFGPSIRSKGNEVIVPASGESAEEIARASAVKQKGVILAGDLNIITPSPRFDSLFLALSISNGRSYNDLVRRAQGATIVHLRNSDLQELEIATPSLPEQQAIGTYFRNLDDLITAEDAKLTKLTQLKSALLDGMFV